MRQGVANINAQIHRLAPVLNTAPAPMTVAVVPADDSVPIDVMTRDTGDGVYIFAVAMRLGETEARFSLAGEQIDATHLEVIDEDRTVPLQGDTFVDHFDPYEVHIYRLSR